MEDTRVVTKQGGSQFRDLHFSFAGYSQTHASHSYGPALRQVYVIHVILSGRGSYAIGNQRYSLKEGQGFVVPPGETTYYQADAEDPWTYVWIGLDGDLVGTYLAEAGLQDGAWSFEVLDRQAFKSLIFECLSHSEATVQNELALQGQAYRFLELLLATGRRPRQGIEVEKFSRHVQATLDLVRDHSHENLSVSAIARQLAVNPSYLARLFKKEMKQTIKEYMNAVRLHQAANLLTTTDLPVEELAHQLGFSGSPSFSKAFKQVWGQSPSAYRHLFRNDQVVRNG